MEDGIIGFRIDTLKRPLILIGVAIICLFALKGFAKWLRRYLLLKRVPGPSDVFPPYFFIKSIIEKAPTVKALEITHEVTKLGIRSVDEYARPGEGVTKFYVGFTPVVALSSAQSIEVILTDNVNISKPFVYQFFEDYIGDSILLATGNLLRFQRKLVAPALHLKLFDSYAGIANKHASKFVEYLMKQPEGEDIRLLKETAKCALNSSGEMSLGYNFDALSAENYYGNALATLQFVVVLRAMQPWMWINSIFKYSMEGKVAKKCIETMHSLSTRMMKKFKQERMEKKEAGRLKGKGIDETQSPLTEEKQKFKSLIEILLEAHEQDPARVTEELCRVMVDAVIFVGMDTTSSAISWFMFELGHNLDIQEKCRQEIFDVLGPDPSTGVTVEHLKSMKYLDACLKELFRLWPSIPVYGRYLDTDIKIKGLDKSMYTIPAGVNVAVSLYHLHRDPFYFPNPEKFDPGRFLDENAPHKKHLFSYVPFSFGPRSCIGVKIAPLHVKVFMTQLLRNFRWTTTTARENLKLVFEVTLKSRGDLRVRLEPLRPTESPRAE